MTIETTHQGDFNVISDGMAAAIVRGSKVGPVFRNATDAIDWGHDTACGDAIPPGYDIAPLQGAVAGLVLLSLAFEVQAAFQKADDAWHAALVERYGKDAGTMRYLAQGSGMECEKVKTAHSARYAAMRAYMAMQQATRMTL